MELAISDGLRGEADQLHRSLHRELNDEILKKRPLNRPEAISTCKEIWHRYRQQFLALMPG